MGESVVIEELAPGRMLAHTDAGDLPFMLDGETARVECEALGAWLGYARPRKARELATKLARDGILSDSEFCPVSGQTRVGRPAHEIWLSRSGALKLAARSETAKAAALLDLMVRAFEAVIDRRAIPTSPAAIDLRAFGEMIAVALRSALAPIAARLDALETASAPITTGVIGANTARVVILDPLVRAARIVARTTDTPFQSVISRMHSELRSQLRFPAGRGHAFANLPSGRLGDATNLVRQITERAHDADVRQAALPFQRAERVS